MVIYDGVKFACLSCVRGHRSTSCSHTDRPLIEIRRKGRPISQCAYCRDLRKTKQIHTKCACKKRKGGELSPPNTQLFPSHPGSPKLSSQSTGPVITTTTSMSTTTTSASTAISTTAEPIAAYPDGQDAQPFFFVNIPSLPLGFCGSLTPHPLCLPTADGESVMVTVTPLGNNATTTTATRIVTCYRGSSCTCPSCLVHAKDAFDLTSSASSSCWSSDDDL